MKIICECCKKRVATIEEDVPQYHSYVAYRAKATFNVCRKCFDASEKSGLIKQEFYAHYIEFAEYVNE